MAEVKMVALQRVWKYEKGQEFDVPESQVRPLELLGHAKRVEAGQSVTPARRGPGRPRTTTLPEQKVAE